MAYVEIHEITQTLGKVFNYGSNDKVKLVVEEKDDLKDALAYAEKDKQGEIVVYKTISTGINCTPATALDVSDFLMNSSKEKRGKKKIQTKSGEEVIGWHCTQTFEESPSELSQEKAHELGLKFAKEMFGDFPCVVSTHCNTGHIHNHIVFGAWNVHGKKHNNNNSKYAEMRRCSDKLCDEYGLSVMEKTREVKLLKWVDEKGKTHYYEPTERKDAIRDGEFANVGDYRNTKAYEAIEIFKKTNREVIQEDIDNLLPSVDTYEELLDCLRNVGYTVSDRKKNGEWLSHISFKAPMQDSATRDYKLGDGTFYTREILTAHIEKMVAERSSVTVAQEEKRGNIFLALDREEVDEEYRPNSTVERGGIERFIISDAKAKNQELRASYRDALRICREKSEAVMPDKRSQYLYDCITANLRTLQFVEQKNIRSFESLNHTVSILYSKRNEAREQLAKIKTVLERGNESLLVLEKYNQLKRDIEAHSGDTDYEAFEKSADIQVLRSYEAVLKQRSLIEPDKQEKFRALIKSYTKRFNDLAGALKQVNTQIAEYDDCVYTLNRIDQDSRNVYQKEVKDYYAIRDENRKEKGKRKGEDR